MVAVGVVFPNAVLEGYAAATHIWRRSDASDCDMQGLIRRRILDALRTDFGRIAHAFRMRCGSRILGEGRRAESADRRVSATRLGTRAGLALSFASSSVFSDSARRPSDMEFRVVSLPPTISSARLPTTLYQAFELRLERRNCWDARAGTTNVHRAAGPSS